MTGFTDIELSIVLKHFETKNIKKKTNLLKSGTTAKEIYFIVTGCIRLFYEKDGKDISAYFFTEKMFAGAYGSFISQKPSRHSIEALEDCHVLSISYKTFQKLFIEFPKMNEFVRKVPEERYLNLQKERPDLLQRIPQHQIATFLGITPVSQSRIRNRVTKK